VDIKLSFATWGGSGADGFAVSLINGSQNIIQPGGYGGSLGYAQRNSPAPQPGLLGGILGIGVDEFGNFSTPGEGRVGGTSAQPNSIAIRGPGDGTANATTTNGQPNYGYLTAGTVAHPLQTGADGTTTRPSNVYQADLTIGTQLIAQGHLPITVTLTDANGAQTVINSYDAYNALVAYYGGAANIPQTMDIGFSGGTGSLTNVHEIRDLTISSVDDISGPSDVPEPPLRSLVLIALAMIVFGSTWSRKILAKAKQTADYL
jgi:MSHA biogenesis protein MshQ